MGCFFSSDNNVYPADVRNGTRFFPPSNYSETFFSNPRSSVPTILIGANGLPPQYESCE